MLHRKSRRSEGRHQTTSQDGRENTGVGVEPPASGCQTVDALESRIVLDAPVRVESPVDLQLSLTGEEPSATTESSIPASVDVGELIRANRAPRAARVEAAAPLTLMAAHGTYVRD